MDVIYTNIGNLLLIFKNGLIEHKTYKFIMSIKLEHNG